VTEVTGAARSSTPDASFSLLVVCTGNICRSPLAERVGQNHLARRLGDAAGLVRIDSAGTRAVVGSEMHPASARVLTALGGDPTGFRARQLTDGLAAGADLTLTMTRDHRRQVLARAPRAMPRTFTLREAAGLLELPGTDVDLPGSTPGERARALVAMMAAARSRRPGSPADDVLDPIGRPEDVHAEVGQLVVEALVPVLERLAAALDGRDAGRLPAGAPAP
jgi:protein-tyrosine phosphatase